MKAIRIACTAADVVPLERLRVLQDNLKSLSNDSYEKLRNEIDRHGFSFAIHVWKIPGASGADLGILDGTQRFRAARRMVDKEGYTCSGVPVNYVEAATEREAVLKCLAAAGMYGRPEDEGLAALMKKHNIVPGDIPNIQLPGIQLPTFAAKHFGAGEPDREREEKVPEPPKEARSKRGELYLLGEHRLLCGDSTSKDDVARLMQGGDPAELCFTSPPYSDQRNYAGNLKLDPEHLATFVSIAAPHVVLFAVNLGLQRRDGEIYQYWDHYIASARHAGLKLLSWNVWDKGECGSIGNQTAMFGICHEWIFVFGSEKKNLNRTIPNKYGGELCSESNTIRERDGSLRPVGSRQVNDFSQLKTVLRQSALKARNLGYDHPAAFPVEFPVAYIEACTQTGTQVYEPFGGSGSTLIACEKTKRKARVMELAPIYCDVILDRWAEFTGKDPVREDGTPWSKIKTPRKPRG